MCEEVDLNVGQRELIDPDVNERGFVLADDMGDYKGNKDEGKILYII